MYLWIKKKHVGSLRGYLHLCARRPAKVRKIYLCKEKRLLAGFCQTKNKKKDSINLIFHFFCYFYCRSFLFWLFYYSLLNKSWRQHPTRHQLYGHLPPITKTIQVRRTWHAGHCWRSRDELISDVLLWTPTHGHAKAGRPARTYIQQLCEDTGCCPEDLPEAMNDREKWREGIRDICATSTTWWWWLLFKSDNIFISIGQNDLKPYTSMQIICIS